MEAGVKEATKKRSLGEVFKDKKKLASWRKLRRIFQARRTAGAKVYRETRKARAFGEFPLILCD